MCPRFLERVQLQCVSGLGWFWGRESFYPTQQQQYFCDVNNVHLGGQCSMPAWFLSGSQADRSTFHDSNKHVSEGSKDDSKRDTLNADKHQQVKVNHKTVCCCRFPHFCSSALFFSVPHDQSLRLYRVEANWALRHFSDTLTDLDYLCGLRPNWTEVRDTCGSG